MKNTKYWKPTKIYSCGNHFFVNPFGSSVGSCFITLEWFRVLKQTRPYISGRIIDLGCGNVPLYEFYKDNATKIICIDWLNTAHKQIHIDKYCDLNEEIDIEENSADCVLLTSVLEHIRKPRVLLNEIARVLVPQGILILSVPYLYNLHETPHDYFRYTKYGLEELAQANSLEILNIEYYGNVIGVLVDIFAKIAYRMVCCTVPRLFFFLPKKFRRCILLLANIVILIFQYISYIINIFPLFRFMLEKCNLADRMPLGYVGIFRKT